MTTRAAGAFFASASMHALLVAVAMILGSLMPPRADPTRTFILATGANPAPSPGNTARPPAVLPLAEQIEAMLVRARRDGSRQAHAEREAASQPTQLFAREQKPTAQPTAVRPRFVPIKTGEIRDAVLGAGRVENAANERMPNRAAESEVDAYIAHLRQTLTSALERTGGLADGLETHVRVEITADGRLVGAQILRTSGNPRFDRAVLTVIADVRLPSRPKGLEPVQVIPFGTRARR